jgi:hypothetical protein
MGESMRRERSANVKQLLVEAGASPARLRVERAMGPTLIALVVADIALIVVGGALTWLGLAALATSLAVGAAVGWNRLRTIDKVRWVNGNRHVSPGRTRRRQRARPTRRLRGRPGSAVAPHPGGSDDRAS